MSEALTELLGEAPPAGVLALSPDDQRRLAEVISAAKGKQRQDLMASFEATLKHVPFPLRGVVKKVLVG